MAYVLRDQQGNIVAVSPELKLGEAWCEVSSDDSEYLNFLDIQLNKHHAFRESDIQLARVLEDLINILIDRSLISFTDFPSPAQKRLNERQTLRHKHRLHLLGDDDLPPL